MDMHHLVWLFLKLVLAGIVGGVIAYLLTIIVFKLKHDVAIDIVKIIVILMIVCVTFYLYK